MPPTQAEAPAVPPHISPLRHCRLPTAPASPVGVRLHSAASLHPARSLPVISCMISCESQARLPGCNYFTKKKNVFVWPMPNWVRQVSQSRLFGSVFTVPCPCAACACACTCSRACSQLPLWPGPATPQRGFTGTELRRCVSLKMSVGGPLHLWRYPPSLHISP